MGRLTTAGVSLALLVAIPACATAIPYSGTGMGAVGTIREGFTIGLLLPGRRGERHDRHDRPAIVSAVAALCPKCKVVAVNADGDHVTQERQLSALLADGVRVLILAAVRPEAATSSVAKAKLLGAKVVAYERLANGPVDAYTAFEHASSGAEGWPRGSGQGNGRREPLDVTRLARSAARLAVDLACGKTVYGTTTVANGTTASIPAVVIPQAETPRRAAGDQFSDGSPSARIR